MFVVCLHNVVGSMPDPFDAQCSRIGRDTFEQFLHRVKSQYDLVRFDRFLSYLSQPRGHEASLALSFDDGFLGVHKWALPILQNHGVSAAAFINPFHVGKRIPLHFVELEIAFRLSAVESLQTSGGPDPIRWTV